MLLLRVPEGKTMTGYYDLPGGRIDEQEKKVSLRNIIMREIREELGKKVRLRVKEVPVAVGQHWHYSRRLRRERFAVLVFFEAHYLGGALTVSHEHEEYRWAKVNKGNCSRYFVCGLLSGMKNYLEQKFVGNPKSCHINSL